MYEIYATTITITKMATVSSYEVIIDIETYVYLVT
jgi:hypothetical protein